MLPRVARLEAEFSDALMTYVRQQSRRNGILGSIHGHIIHEGEGTAIQRSPNDFEKTDMFTSRAETVFSFDEIEAVNDAYIIKKAMEIAEQFSRQLSQNLFHTIDEATKKTGQHVDARGTPLTNELLMEMLSKMSIDFEKSPHGDLTIVTSPQMASRFQALEIELNEKPDVRKKMDELMDRKRDEFREREANRNLAG